MSTYKTRRKVRRLHATVHGKSDVMTVCKRCGHVFMAKKGEQFCSKACHKGTVPEVKQR
jgi:ribosomal protein L32